MRRHPEPAIERARQAWRGAANVARQEIRAHGLPASEWLHDQAAQKRGVQVADSIGRFALELLDARVPRTRVVGIISDAVDAIITARTETPSPVHPPRAA